MFYSLCIIFSYTFYPRTKYEFNRMNSFRNMVIENYTRRLTAVILNLVQTEVETFDPPTRKPYHRTKHEADRMIRSRDMAVRNFPKCEVSPSSIHTLFSCTSLRYVRNVAREE